MGKQPGLSETVAAVEKPTEDTMEEESSMVSTPVTAVKKAAEKRPRTEESEDEGDKSRRPASSRTSSRYWRTVGRGTCLHPSGINLNSMWRVY